MQGARASRLRGFTYLELVIVIALISTLAYFAMDRLLRLQVTAEKAGVEQMVGTIQSALALQIAKHIARDRIEDLQSLAGSNPMRLLAQPPESFRIVAGEDGAAAVRPGTWYFDNGSGVLGYRVLNREYFHSAGRLSDHIKFKLLAVYDDNNSNDRRDPGEALQGLRLARLHAYRWSIEPLKDTDRPERVATTGE